jgi:hypothetical protein
MYEDPGSYVEYIDAYKKFIIDVARVMTREAGQNVPDANLTAAVEDLFEFERVLATVKINKL